MELESRELVRVEHTLRAGDWTLLNNNNNNKLGETSGILVLFGASGLFLAVSTLYTTILCALNVGCRESVQQGSEDLGGH